jgi:tetratricopeptide (TPR) repeat protein
VRELWDRVLRRRDFRAGAGASATVALLGSPAASFGHDSPDLDEAMAAQATLTATYRRLEGMLGPHSVYTQTLDHHRLLTSWLRRIDDEQAWRQVAVLSADAAILLAWLHFDLEQYDQAALVYRRTLDVADELQDVDLQAFLVGRMSRTLSECERDHEALVFADLAGRLGDNGAMPAVRSWLAATRAYVHACLGDERASRDDLDRAYNLLDDADSEPLPLYIAFFGRPYLHKWAGHTLLRLAEHRAAAPREGRSVIDQALALWPSSEVRESGEVLVASASAQLAERHVDEAARLTLRAYDVATRTGSPRILRHVTDLRQRMTPYRQTKAVRSLDEHLLTGR